MTEELRETEKSEIRKKEFTYRGLTVDELKKMDVREFSKYIKSKPRRTVLRQFQKIEDFISRANVKLNKNKPIRTHERSLVIVPEMVGMKINIHDGRNFIPVI